MKFFLFSVFVTFVMLAMTCKNQSKPAMTDPAKTENAAPQTYTCPMHPEVKSDKPGQCPKCGMDLVPMAADSTHHH